jgi:hypothetical protein
MKLSIAAAVLILLVASSAQAQRCPGDNNGDRSTTVDEIVTAVVTSLDGCTERARFVDNGDGTISDHETLLMWEKKADWDDAAVNCASAAQCPDPHDADNRYNWGSGDPALPDGTAHSVFLVQLNGTCDGDNSVACTTDAECSGIGSGLCGFAGHRDWRLPTPAELVSIVDYASTTSPAVDAAFNTACSDGCTRVTCSCTPNSSFYLSSMLVAAFPQTVWGVDFYHGGLNAGDPPDFYNTRAVRSGL